MSKPKIKVKIDRPSEKLTKKSIKMPIKIVKKRFERWPIFKDELNNLTKQLNEIDDDIEKIKYLQDLYIETDRKIDEIEESSTDIKSILNNYDRRKYEVTIDLIRKFLEEILNKNEELVFKYPELFDSEFAKKIYEKKEFYINKMPIGMVIQEASNKPRQRTSIQKFVKNYISEYTPYNGILLWHGVGVGKTCAGISIAENFRDYVQASKQKLLVLTPSDTLVQTWKDEIFNIEKEEIKRKAGQIVNVQCTGDRYLSELKKVNRDSLEISRREVNRLINKYYEIMGYQKLANQVNKELLLFIKNKKYQQRAVIEYFKHKFSNRVIIMDEVHFTREDGSANDKIARPFLEMIARYAENVKIVLLSATPMYNISSEISWIMNLLLWNDKRAPIEPEDLFEKNGITLKEKTIDGENVLDKIRKISRGYISYLRSENPLTFPLKLDPWYEDPNRYTPNPEYQLIGGEKVELPDKEKIPKDAIIFYRDQMNDWQYKNVEKVMNIIPDGESEIDIDDIPEGKSGFTSKPTQASNIVFPINEIDKDGDYTGEIGESGFNSCLIPNAQKKLEYASHVRNIEGKPFLHIDNIGKYSAKFKNIINLINNSIGIIFVYSQFVKGGVKALACALEANGYCRYIGDGKVDNLLADNKSKDPSKRYILLDGSVAKSQLNTLVKECRGTTEHPNTNGEFIKVILGTKVIETGISFLRVREIHILDPWHHLNTMEQAAGRGIRNFSHIQLPVSERNVTRYLHIGALPEGNKSGLETNDERIYRRAYIKKKNMALVERQLKISAVDCGLNRMGNIFVPELYDGIKDNPLEPRLIITSQKPLDKHTLIKSLYDENGSMICDFEDCDYKCDPDISEIKSDQIQTSTFNEFYAEDEIELVKELIKNMFTEEYVFSDQEIFEILRDMKIELEEHYIYLALNDLVENKNEVLDGYYRPGYIINRTNKKTGENFYIFQPKDIKNENIPMIYRYLKDKTYIKKQNIDNLKIKLSIKKKEEEKPALTTVEPIETKVTSSSIFTSKNFLQILEAILQQIINIFPVKLKSYFEKKGSKTKLELIPNIYQLYQYNLESILDKLKYTDKLIIFQNIIPYLNSLNISTIDLTNNRELVLYTILKYYDKQNERDDSYLFLRSKRDLFDKAGITLGDISKDEIVGFRLIYREIFNKNGKMYDGETNIDYYLLKDDNLYHKQNKISNDNLNEKLKISAIYNTFNYDRDQLYGYLNHEITKFMSEHFKDLYKNPSKLISDIEINKTLFYIINTITGGPGQYTEKKDKENRKLKKADRRGAKCGSAKGAYYMKDFIWIILELLTVDLLQPFETINKESEEFITNQTNIKNELDLYEDKTNKLSCVLLIELLLRHNEHRIKNQNRRFFYKFEDTLLPSCNVSEKNKRVCGAKGINKPSCLSKSCCYETPPEPNIPTCFYPSER